MTPNFVLPSRAGAYRWYYLDFTHGEYTAVFIFMIGSIFSARYSASAKKGGLPREHAAVNFALYEKGVRWQWVLTEYQDVRLREDGRRLEIGDSWIEASDHAVQVHVRDRTTPFAFTQLGRPTEATLRVALDVPGAEEVRLVAGKPHWWQAFCARGQAQLVVPNHGLKLDGLGYHDGNHGDVPLGGDLPGWEWERTHGRDRTTIDYRPRGAPAWRIDARPTGVSVTHPAERTALERTRSNWGLSVPKRLGDAPAALLESSPFYARLEGASADGHVLGEVADFQRFHSPAVRWLSRFRTRVGGAA